MDEETICTSYTITGNTIVFVGSDTSSWNKLLEGTWTKDVPGTDPGGQTPGGTLPPEASAAPSLTIGEYKELNAFVNAGDVKWVKFTATAATTYLWMNLGTGESVNFQLYDTSGATVGSGGTFTGNSDYEVRQSQTVTVNSTYYIKLTIVSLSLGDDEYAAIGFTNNTTAPNYPD